VKQEPLWQQTVTKLKRGILASENCAGARFPSLTDLSREYGISKISALRAVSELEQAGLVKRIPRRGTFIIGRSRPRAIRVLLDFKQGWPANILPIIWEYMRGVEAQ